MSQLSFLSNIPVEPAKKAKKRTPLDELKRQLATAKQGLEEAEQDLEDAQDDVSRAEQRIEELEDQIEKAESEGQSEEAMTAKEAARRVLALDYCDGLIRDRAARVIEGEAREETITEIVAYLEQRERESALASLP